MSRFLFACGFAVATLLSVTASATPPPVDGELPATMRERTVEPEAGYLRTNIAFFLQRRLADEHPEFVPPPTQALSGTRAVPVICLRYKNRPQPSVRVGSQTVPLTTTFLSHRLFGDPSDSGIRATLTQYYRDVSEGRLTVTGQVLGWYALPEDDSYYENNTDTNGNGRIDPNDRLTNGGGPKFKEMLTFGLEKADAEVDFGQFDNDGPDGVANSGDDDGKADLVFFVQPEAGGECGQDAFANVWSHFWSYGKHGGSASFLTNDARRELDGTPMSDADGRPLRIEVVDYTIQPALSCSSATPAAPPRPVEIGVFCHEYGHALGLPDLYDRQAPTNGSIGSWCLMAQGSYGGDALHSDTPTLMSAWCRYRLGWSDVETVLTNGPVAIEASYKRGRMHRIAVPDTSDEEYFLVEYRDTQLPSDGSWINWDRFLPGPGIAVWHVDDRVGAASPAWPFASLGQGQNDDGSLPRPGSSPSAWASPHALVALVQADGKYDLAARRPADVGDLFGPSQAFEDDPTLTHGSRGYDGKASGIAVKDIRLDQKSMVVQVHDPELMASSAEDRSSSAGAAEPSPTAEAKTEQALKAFHDWLQEPTPAELRSLTIEQRHMLARLDPIQLQPWLAPEQMTRLEQVSAQARTFQVKSAELKAVANKDVAKRLEALDVAGDVTVRLSPGGERVERLIGLNLPPSGASRVEDAQRRLEAGFNELLAPGVELRPVPDTTEFQQVYREANRVIPVHDSNGRFYYDTQNRLQGVRSSVLGDLQVSGRIVELAPSRVQAAIAEQLRLPSEVAARLGTPVDRVYAVGREPGHARLAWKVDLSIGEGHEDLHVFVDQESMRILGIE